MDTGSSIQNRADNHADEQLDGNVIVYPIPESLPGTEDNGAEEKVDLLRREGAVSAEKAIGVFVVSSIDSDENEDSLQREADTLVSELKKQGILAGVIGSALFEDEQNSSSANFLHNVEGLRQVLDETESTIGSDTDEHAIIAIADSDKAVKEFALPPRVAVSGQPAVLVGLGYNGQLNAGSWQSIPDSFID